MAARKRIAGCLVEARPLQITGGNFELCPACPESSPMIRLCTAAIMDMEKAIPAAVTDAVVMVIMVEFYLPT